MAQGSKSRMIIWAIVGVLVVVAVVMLISKPKDMGKPVDADQLTRSYARLFERLEKKTATVQSEYPGAPAEQMQKINEGVALGRAILGRVPGLTEQKDLVAKRDSLKEVYVTAIRSLKAITGQDEEAPEGGK
ncbi:hypothetical protein FJY68_09305 [candidate division WOR-3 bacterium]|uniref:Uncharacterized protein n=1 Tax=candidate division WOR-3 bacterium TaxID=2052148 RepID=A0A937XGJ7_UNCW3|nr:hypothetical protein [candidate division WOR-3 bacterium]